MRVWENLVSVYVAVRLCEGLFHVISGFANLLLYTNQLGRVDMHASGWWHWCNTCMSVQVRVGVCLRVLWMYEALIGALTGLYGLMPPWCLSSLALGRVCAITPL